MRRIAFLTAALSMASACGGAGPTAPGTSQTGPLIVVCNAPTILAGDYVICAAFAASVNVSTVVAWKSSDPTIATLLGQIGAFVGKQEGVATLTATYSGQSASAVVTVHLQDVLRVSAAAYQGTFKVGTTATLFLQGSYGVASADFGTLTLVVTDQNGTTVSTSAAQTVPHGGDTYIMSTTFTIPPGATRVCRAAVLQIGSTTLTMVPDVSLVPCFTVTP